MPDTPTFGRYAEIPVEQMTAEQQAGYRFLVDGPHGRFRGALSRVGAQSRAGARGGAARHPFYTREVGAVGARAGDCGARYLQHMGLSRPDELA